MLVQTGQAESPGPFAEKTMKSRYFHTLYVTGSVPVLLQGANLLKSMIYVLRYVGGLFLEGKKPHQERNTSSFQKMRSADGARIDLKV